MREVEANISPSYFEHVPWSATTQQMVTHLLFITISYNKVGLWIQVWFILMVHLLCVQQVTFTLCDLAITRSRKL